MHELLIAKLSAYGFSPNALQLVHSYLSERKQKVKVNGSFSTWRETMIGVPQGSVLGPLLFNIYLNDLFMFVKDAQICNYADDTTIYACDSNIEGVIHRRRRQGAGGLQPSQRWKKLQKSAIIGQKIGLKSGKILVNNMDLLSGSPPEFYFLLCSWCYSNVRERCPQNCRMVSKQLYEAE